MIKFHQDFIRKRWWLEWNNWHYASNNQSTRNLSSKNILSFDKRDCSNQQSYSCLASKFHEDIVEHLSTWKSCHSNDATYIINLQRWKWYKDHWLYINSSNYESSYLWWVVTWHKRSWLDERNNDRRLRSCAVSDSAFKHSIDFCLFHIQIFEKLFKFNENRDSNKVCKNLNNERRLIMQSLYNDLNYDHEKLKIQFLIDWRTKSDEWEQDDNIMLLNLILKLAHYMKDLNWIFDYTLSKLFSNMLIINQEMIRLLHLSEKIIKWDFNVWKCCRKCKSFIMSKTRLN